MSGNCKACENLGCAMQGTDWTPNPAIKCFGLMAQTNYDRLISKTPEELADWLCQTQYREGDFCPPKHDGWQYCIMSDGCRVCWIDWLKSPVEENE